MASARLAYHSATGRRTFLLCVAVSFMPIQRSHTDRSLRLPSRSQTSSPSTRQRRQGSRDRCGCNEHACDWHVLTRSGYGLPPARRMFMNQLSI